MANQELEARLEKVLRNVLGLGASPARPGLRRAELPEWDSLRHVKLMLDLQAEFGVRFQATEIAGLDSFEALRASLAQKLPPPQKN